jgi:hypothetical protein
MVRNIVQELENFTTELQKVKGSDPNKTKIKKLFKKKFGREPTIEEKKRKEKMLDKEIEIVVMSGVVAKVNNLPKGYTYKIKDLDISAEFNDGLKGE